MKRTPETLIASTIAGISGTLLVGTCLYLRHAISPDTLPTWGAWLFWISVGAGFVAMIHIRHRVQT